MTDVQMKLESALPLTVAVFRIVGSRDDLPDDLVGMRYAAVIGPEPMPGETPEEWASGRFFIGGETASESVKALFLRTAMGWGSDTK
jgi:hypothetical protein